MEKKFKDEEWKAFREKECDHSIEEIYVSNYGRLKRKIPRKKEFRNGNFVKGNGFDMFYFRKKGNKHASFYLHRAVAILFIENDDPKKEFVIHLDHNILNNHVSNLKWVNRKELTKHQFTNPKRIAVLEKKLSAKLTVEQVKIIKRKLTDPKEKIKKIAEEFGVSTMQIYRIRAGKVWIHVTDF